VSEDDGFKSCHEDEEQAKKAQTDRLAKDLLKKKFKDEVSSDEQRSSLQTSPGTGKIITIEEEKQSEEAPTQIPGTLSGINENLFTGPDDHLLSDAYRREYAQNYLEITDPEEKSKNSLTADSFLFNRVFRNGEGIRHQMFEGLSPRAMGVPKD
jgi:hypothetical protein